MKLSNTLIIVLVVAFIATVTVSANGVFFLPPTVTSTATSTKVTVSPATSAVTLDLDTYQQGRNTGSDAGVLLLQSTGSSTSAVVGVTFQYSQDGIDWYDDSSRYGTTSAVSNGATVAAYTIPQTTSLAKKTLPFNPYTRYVRAVITGTTATSTVWAQFVIKKEVLE